jgi:hypothetical protein
VSEKQVETVLHINSYLAWKYHIKYSYISKVDFVEVGYVAIAEAISAWRRKRKGRKNFEGYVKVWIQGRYNKYLETRRKEYQLSLMIARVSAIFRYTSIRSTEQEDENALPGQSGRPGSPSSKNLSGTAHRSKR